MPQTLVTGRMPVLRPDGHREQIGLRAVQIDGTIRGTAAVADFEDEAGEFEDDGAEKLAHAAAR